MRIGISECAAAALFRMPLVPIPCRLPAASLRPRQTNIPSFCNRRKNQALPVALLGLRQDENVFVSKDGAWDSAYVPFRETLSFPARGETGTQRLYRMHR
jgi:hypothetical protein